MKSHPDKGALRETFLLNQFINVGREPTAPVKGDFLLDGLTIEVGGKSKTSRQVGDAENYLVAADNIEAGSGNNVPLWLFGFMY